VADVLKCICLGGEGVDFCLGTTGRKKAKSRQHQKATHRNCGEKNGIVLT